MKPKVLMAASVASMIDQFNMSNIRLLQELGCEVHVACNFKEGNTCTAKRIRSLQESLKDMQVIQHQWDCPRNPGNVLRCGRAYRQLWELTGRYTYAWMHCHSPMGGVLARMVAYRRAIRVIYTAHGFHFYRGAPLKNRLIYYPAEKLLSYGTDLLLTINREDYSFARRRLSQKKVCYIPGVGIDVKKFQSLCKEQKRMQREQFCYKYKIPQEAVVLLSVGELSRRKNHQLVLSAMAELAREDVYYVICGRGACRNRLLRQAARLGISSHIRMIGFQEDMVGIYQSADAFVFPSLQEGMPVALMEAMAAGLPCIVSDIRGSRELITEQGGSMFQLGLHRAGYVNMQLLEQMVRLLRQPHLWERYGRYNQEKMKGYDMSVVNRKMKSIYGEFIEEFIKEEIQNRSNHDK